MHLTRMAGAALSVAAFTVHAADRAIPVAPEVVVTATRFNEPAERFPIGVQVITQDDIKRSTAATVPDLLRQLPGIRTRDNSGSPNVQVDIRGFGIFGDQNTLVLLDGVRISENEQTTVNWAGIPLSAIERIEIMRGSGAVLYGGGATGGTINIITKAPGAGQRSAVISGGVGSYNTREAGLGASLAGENVGLRFNATYLDTDNYRDNNEMRLENVLADARWMGGAGNLSLKVGADDQKLRLPGALNEAQIAANRRQAATPRDFSNRWGGFVNLGGDTRLGAGELAANLGYRERNTRASIIGSPIDADTTVWSFSPRWKIPYRLGGVQNSLVAGFDWDDWEFENRTAVFGAARLPVASQRNRAIYFQNTTALGPDWSLAAGARLHRVAYGVDDVANAAPGETRARDLSAYELAARYRVSPAAAVYGKFGYSFRVPNVNDVYNLFSGAVFLLEPQTSHDREIGVDIASGPASYRVALYHMDLDNELFFDPALFINRNLPPTRRYGIETEGKWRAAGGLDFFANYAYAVSQFRSGAFGGVPIAGNDVPLVPRHTLNAGAGWAFAARARADIVLRYIGEQPYDGDETATFGRKMPAYTVVDLKVAYEDRGWLLSAGVRNLFNEKYYSYAVFSPAFPPFFPADFFAYPQPERSFFMTAQYAFR